MLTSEQRDELKTLILEYGIAAVMESSESRPRQINRIIDFVSGVAAASDARAEGRDGYVKGVEAAALTITEEPRDGNWYEFNVNGHGGVIRVVARMDGEDDDLPLGNQIRAFLLSGSALIDERDAAVMRTHMQAFCIQQCAAHIGPDTATTLYGLPKAVKRIVQERDEARAALARASEAAEVPAGYKLVPVEPTVEMLNAALPHDATFGHGFKRRIYQEMVAAAPTMSEAESMARCALAATDRDRVALIHALQKALAYWMPSVFDERSEHDAYLLVGDEGETEPRCWGDEMMAALPRWTPVGDSLPAEPGWYLAMLKPNNDWGLMSDTALQVEFDAYTSKPKAFTCFYEYCGDEDITEAVTHWMPMPRIDRAAAKGESDEQ